MARHDREESLEEQLAWLDAIKETEETPVSVGAPIAAADEPVASPYPKDPWSLVPAQHDTPTPPLFRAAVDSVYGSAAAEELPAEESEAGEWLDRVGTQDSGTGQESAAGEPAVPPASLGRSDDPFLAPLKPLPRPDDTDSYSLSFTPPEQPFTTSPEPAESAAKGTERGTEKDATKSAEDAEEAEEPGWPSLADWSRPTEQPSGETLPMITELPKAFGEPARTEPDPEPDERATVEEETADERPRWDERPQWSESSFRGGRPQWPDPVHTDPAPPSEPAPPSDLALPSDPVLPSDPKPESGPRIDFAFQADTAPRIAPPFQTGPAPGEAARDERPQWSDRQEWRPAEREIPPPRERHRRPAPIPVFTAPPRPPLTGRPTADSLDPESLLRGRRNAPAKGWRRLVYKASGGWIKPGEAPEVRRRRELVTRARTPVTTGHHRVAVLSLKGGVGKTTTTVGLGATLAQMRGDRVIAVDANPDRGTLSDKLVLETSATVRDLLNERDQVKRYVDIRAFTSQAPSRLEVLASDRDPSVSEAFSGSDYQAVSQVLENFYSICITDCGTGLLHSAMGGVLGLADQIVLVSSPSVDGARAASATLDWLEAHHYADLVKNATVVLCSVRPRSKSAVDIRKLEAHFAARCRAVIRVPYDPHLEEGAEIDLDRLQEATRESYLQLAASVGDGFAGVRE
ncbi:MinD/ParA family protein [Nonomuraea sp. WAC 01424]|uniref:MinD/ParA family ATP-binding protein n=1 Tax=Nonomuraea sp. WAC 01424 TaxID=2203200 RepID=UPI0021AD9D9D|nr:AAA family ATPase [Nonomuraea sp. WAC 01424]